MFSRIYSALRGECAVSIQTSSKPDELQVAVGALLVEAAMRDDVFDAAESAAITRILAERFDLAEDATKQLFEESEKANHGVMELFGFVRKLIKDMDEAQRIEVVEMLWEVAYADGVLDAHEDAIIRKVAGLLYVSDYARGAARRRVREKLELLGSNAAEN
jgi:uncharacterized tellurite resistance protein B-like protein